VVTAAELLAAAAFAEGRYAQAFPSFGSERTGAPVVSFCRISNQPIRTREPVMHPDALIIQDPTPLHQVNVFEGIASGVIVLVNSARGLAELGITDITDRLGPTTAMTVPATELAQRHLGRPVPNAALLGGFAAVSGVVSIESVLAAIRERFSDAVAEPNAAAAREAFTIAEREIAEARRPGPAGAARPGDQDAASPADGLSLTRTAGAEPFGR
jgi:pyruvate ferredoxin oxidoreductase gamma subunit